MPPEHNLGVLDHRVGAVERDLHEHKNVVFDKFDEHRNLITDITVNVAKNQVVIAIFQVVATGVLIYALTKG